VPGGEVKVSVRPMERDELWLTCRNTVDSTLDAEYFRHGGLLPPPLCLADSSWGVLAGWDRETIPSNGITIHDAQTEDYCAWFGPADDQPGDGSRPSGIGGG